MANNVGSGEPKIRASTARKPDTTFHSPWFTNPIPDAKASWRLPDHRQTATGNASSTRVTPRRRGPPQRYVGEAIMAAAMTVGMPTVAKEDVSGYVAVQSEAENKVSGGIDAIAELKYKTRRVESTRAVLGVEGSYYDRTLVLEDLYLDHKPSEQFRLTLGISKKVLGLEYENDKEYRATIHRSPIYQKMEELGIVGRQMNLRLVATPQRGRKNLEVSCAVGMDGSRDLNAQFSVLRDFEAFGVGTWLIAEAHKVSKLYSPMVAEAISVWVQGAGTRGTLELFHGIDTQRTEFHETFGENRKVMFFGSKLEVLHEYKLTNNLKFIPILQSSFWFDDAKRTGNNSLQFLVAARFRVHRVVLSVNTEVTGERRASMGKRNFNDGALYAEAFFSF